MTPAWCLGLIHWSCRVSIYRDSDQPCTCTRPCDCVPLPLEQGLALCHCRYGVAIPVCVHDCAIVAVYVSVLSFKKCFHMLSHWGLPPEVGEKAASLPVMLSMKEHHCAECVGGVIAGLMAGPLYGTGATWLKKLTPWIRPTEAPSGDNNELKDHASRAPTDDIKDSGSVEISPLYNSRKPAGPSTIV